MSRVSEDFEFMVLCHAKGNPAMYELLRDRTLDKPTQEKPMAQTHDITDPNMAPAPAPALQLRFIRSDDENGENFDLLVWAESEPQARQLWFDYYEFHDEDNAAPAIMWIGIVPIHTTPQACSWGDINTTP